MHRLLTFFLRLCALGATLIHPRRGPADSSSLSTLGRCDVGLRPLLSWPLSSGTFMHTGMAINALAIDNDCCKKLAVTTSEFFVSRFWILQSPVTCPLPQGDTTLKVKTRTARLAAGLERLTGKPELLYAQGCFGRMPFEFCTTAAFCGSRPNAGRQARACGCNF